MREEFLPFHRPAIGQEEIDEVVDTLRSGWLTVGPKTKLLEERFAGYVGAKHAVAVNSCTAALHLALAARDIGPSDEVITTTFTFCSTANVIVHQGATPVLVDIEEHRLAIDPAKVEAAVTRRTKAIIAVHYGGQPCDLDALRSIAERHGLLLIEDAAHAAGAHYSDRPIGAIGDVTAFSFYATKTLTTGEGGMLTTDRDDIAERVALLSLHGISKDAWKRYSEAGTWYYEVLAPGYKYNMSDIQAAMGLAQLAKVEGLQLAREDIAGHYEAALGPLPYLITPRPFGRVRHSWHLYPIRLRPEQLKIDRAEFIVRLTKMRIGTSVHFIPVHLHPWYQQRYGLRRGDYPVSERVYDNIISLPIYPGMTPQDVEDVGAAVKEIGDAALA